MYVVYVDIKKIFCLLVLIDGNKNKIYKYFKLLNYIYIYNYLNYIDKL